MNPRTIGGIVIFLAFLAPLVGFLALIGCQTHTHTAEAWQAGFQAALDEVRSEEVSTKLQCNYSRGGKGMKFCFQVGEGAACRIPPGVTFNDICTWLSPYADIPEAPDEWADR